MKVYIEQSKPVLGDVKKNIDLMLKAIDKGIEAKCDLIIFPQDALTGTVLHDLFSEVALDEVPSEILKKSKKIDIIYGHIGLSDEKKAEKVALYLTDGEVIEDFFPMGTIDLQESFEACGIVKEDGIEDIDCQIILGNTACALDSKGDKNLERMEVLARANSYLNKVYTIFVNRIGVEDGVTFSGGSFVVSPEGEIISRIAGLNETSMVVEIDEEAVKRARNK